MEIKSEDLLCVCISRQVEDGEILAQGLATPLVAAGYLLAWHTHAPKSFLKDYSCYMTKKKKKTLSFISQHSDVLET